MSDVLHEVFLPYTAGELLPHFVHFDPEGENPEKFLTKWHKKIDEAARSKEDDPSWLERDETLWTANALMAMQRGPNCADRWQRIMAKLFGPVPPTTKRQEWGALLRSDLEVFFEVAVPSSRPYQTLLREHLPDHHALVSQLAVAKSHGTKPLEGPTHLDALLLSQESGFALLFEAKVLADIDTHTTYDSLRNQLARNIDCMAAFPGSHPVLGKRKPDLSFFVMLTPELFRRNWPSRLYGHLVREYASDPSAIQRDLPHLDGLTCANLSRRVGWLTFEDLRSFEPTVCPWLAPDETAPQAPGIA